MILFSIFVLSMKQWEKFKGRRFKSFCANSSCCSFPVLMLTHESATPSGASLSGVRWFGCPCTGSTKLKSSGTSPAGRSGMPNCEWKLACYGPQRSWTARTTLFLRFFFLNGPLSRNTTVSKSHQHLYAP